MVNLFVGFPRNRNQNFSFLENKGLKRSSVAARREPNVGGAQFQHFIAGSKDINQSLAFFNLNSENNAKNVSVGEIEFDEQISDLRFVHRPK